MKHTRLQELKKKFNFIDLFLEVQPLKKCPLCRKKVKIEEKEEGLYCPNCEEWVSEYTRYECPQITLDNIRVQKISKELMLFTPVTEKFYSPLADIERINIIYFIIKGKKHAIYSQQDIYFNESIVDPSSHVSRKKPDVHIDGEAIFEGIKRLNIIPEYIVCEERGYNIISHYSQENWRLTIYKTAKDDKIEDIIKEATTEFEKQKVEAEINF